MIIKDEDHLLRRFPLKASYIKPDNKVASGVFKPRKSDTDGLSVDIERLTNLIKAVIDPGNYGICRITALDIRSIELDVIHDPVEGNHAHALINGKINNRKAKTMALKAQVVNVKE